MSDLFSNQALEWLKQCLKMGHGLLDRTGEPKQPHANGADGLKQQTAVLGGPNSSDSGGGPAKKRPRGVEVNEGSA